MEIVLVLVSGIMFTAACYLILRRHLLRVVIGLIVLSNAANLLIFAMGRLTRISPPLVPDGQEMITEAYANPLPQALILTAIVISFGILAFGIALVFRTFLTHGALDSDALHRAEHSTGWDTAGEKRLPA